MNDLNKVILIGRLTRDAEMKYTNGGMPVSRFSLAVNRRKKSGDNWTDEANFFDIVLFGKSAESINRFLVKGKQVSVEGELRQDRWEQEGQKRSKIEIVAQNIQLLGGTGERSGSPKKESQSFGDYSSNEGANSSADFEDDIPF